MVSSKKLKVEDVCSSDVLVIAKIYEYSEIKKKPISFKGLVRSFKGNLSEGAIGRALERISDLSIISTDWGRTKHRNKKNEGWVRVISIKKGSKEIAKEYYDLVGKLKTILKD